MLVENLLKQINGPKYLEHVATLEEMLAEELHGANGAIIAFRSPTEDKRLKELELAAKLPILNDITTLDGKIEAMTNEFLRINLEHFGPLMYQPLTSLRSIELREYRTLQRVLAVIDAPATSDKLRERLSFVLGKVLSISIVNALKSNAGIAGETFAEAILGSVGLKRDEHYTCQYKSNTGSNTDIVLPVVEHETDRLVEAFVAVQMSTNDRIRLTKSELKKSANAYVITGSGMPAASKSLKDIGTQNLRTTQEANHTLVCHSDAIETELKRCRDQLAKTKGAKKTKDYKDRIKFFKSNAISFAKFAQEMRTRFLHRNQP